ncbi:MAG: quinone oxidoreductase [Acidimicrobiales bacterium]|nr:quinone oxidoreductase [Acidimicrobiales bacterium]MBO0886039.1 quinone oxidoreductase [Acidimicrobiales bacterium]
MRAVQVEAPGGPEVLSLVELPEPVPGPGQLLVEVAAAGVNFVEIYQRSGIYPRPTPFVLGAEGAGVVRTVGPGVEGITPGDRVAWTDAPGSQAESVVVDAERVVVLPEKVSVEIGAAVMLQGLTAHYLATSTYPVKAGETVVVHAGAGGVGLLLTQIVKRRGGRVLATVSSADKEKASRSAGADEVIRYDQVDFAPEVRRLTGGEGVAAVYDGVGRTTFDASLASLRPRGYLVLYGGASGQVPPFDLQRLNQAGSLYVTRPTMAHYLATREEFLSRTGELMGWVASGELDVRIGGRYPLAEVRRAHEDLEGRRTIGKLLLLAR